MNSLLEALTIAKETLRIDSTDTSYDTTLTRFLEASCANCGDSCWYRPWISAAMFRFANAGISGDRYQEGLIKGDGAEWVDPIKWNNAAIVSAIEVQRAMDSQIPPTCTISENWKPDKIAARTQCGCSAIGKDADKPYLGAMVI